MNVKLNPEQKNIVETTDSKVIVMSAPASGKSAIITERLKYLLSQGEDPSKIVCITFTNAAAEELRKRVGNYPSLFIGTVHSYCNWLLRMAGVDTSKIIDEENFDELFEKIKGHPEAIQPVEHLLLDESQDSTSDELYFMLDMVEPKNYMLVGDQSQQLYAFRGADSVRIFELMNDVDTTTYTLNRNYRNGSKIIQFAERIIAKNGKQYETHSICMRQTPGRIVECQWTVSELVNALKRMVENGGSYNDWFVLCRTNEEISWLQDAFAKADIPFDTFRRSELDSDEFQAAMTRDSIKLLTIHASKGLERKKVIVIGARMDSKDERCVSYVAATRAMDLLVWVKLKRPKAQAKKYNTAPPNTKMMDWG